MALAFGVAAAVTVARLVATPISQVSRAAQRAATGDLSARAVVAPRLARFERNSEIGNLVTDFNHMAESLERLEHERQAMIADIAHELRTPLTIVQGQIDAMQYGVVPLNGEQLAKLSVQTELLSRLIKDLHTLSLAEARRLSLNRSEVDLRLLIQDLVDSFQDGAKSKGVRLVLDAPAPVVARVDGDRVAQVLVNLLGNALRHPPEGGEVLVKLAARDEVVLTVANSGDELSEELSEEALECVFDRFYRAEPCRARASGGGGLGLAISKAIVELHGGCIKVVNNAEGAVFNVTLPLKPAA